MADKRTVCLKFDCVADKDILDELDQRFNRTEFIRMCIRNYLIDCRLKECTDDESPYYD